MTKKLTALILVLFLALLGCALGENAYESDFSRGTDGWYARSTGGARISVTQDDTLLITGRSDGWHSPGRDFLLQADYVYELSVEVKQTQAAQANFVLSVAHTADGVESYENLAFGTAKKGEWTTLTGTYYAGPYDRFVLYVETTGAPTLDFEIRRFQLKGEMQQTPTSKYTETEELPALREVYSGLFDLGTAVTYRETCNRTLMDFYASQFNIITPGNEMKPDAMLDVTQSKFAAIWDDTAVAVKFNSVLPLLNYARDNGIKVHGHVLVWHSQTPEAFFHEKYNTSLPLVSREVMLARLDNYVREIMTYLDENYPGVVVSWDVVNEAINDTNGQLRESNWTKVVGEDFVERAFEIARKHAPEGVELYYNDYNTAILVKQNGIMKLLERLMAEGNIDGYGFQMHHDINFPSIQQISASVKRVAATGLKLRVSELDVTIPENSEIHLQRQADMYGKIMQLLKPYAGQLVAVQLWGVTDNLSWRASQFPLVFDRQSQPKPAFWAMVEAAK